LSHGSASGNAGFIIWKWNSAASRMLPREELKTAVRITEIAITPRKNGTNDHELCTVPPNRNAGTCHRAQTKPRIRPAHSGANRRCSRGSPRPRHPNSSIGPNIRARANAGKTPCHGENGKSVTVPATAALAYTIAGTPISRNTHHARGIRHRVSRRRKPPRPWVP
jgi:hypothetical protein